MNYFELFQIPVSLRINQQQLKAKFYQLSRQYHPDFFTQESDVEQADALDMSSLVNKGFKTLSDPDATIKYVLVEKGLLEEDEKYQLPPDFLMEVMELNEELQEASAAGDAEKLQRLGSSISMLQQTIYEPVETIIDSYNDEQITLEELQPVKEYYFKKKYLDRILATIG